VSHKKQAKLFCHKFEKFAQILIIFWPKSGKQSKIIQDALIFTSPNSRQCTTVLNADVPVRDGVFLLTRSMVYVIYCCV